ncbi:MAG: DNA polymerase III subunit delta' [Parvibaculum sp.]|nr:DNA polymerase III subunit delta' [Parvibaculum sp.]
MSKDDDQIPESDRLGEFPHPRETMSLLGQRDAELTIFDAFMSGRMHHAWLLTGPKGIGKATLAYRAARFVLRHGAPEVASAARARDLETPADHPVARQLAAGSHPNVLTLRRPYDDKTKRFKTVLTVDEVRRTASFFGMSAGAGGWRIAIIDAADDMNVSAENAILKILEEPPPQCLFFVIAHQPGRLLPTIRSRCRTLRMTPLPASDVASILAANDIKGSDATRLSIARLSEGSAGRALAIADGGGLDLYAEIVALLMALPRLDIKALHKLADKVARRGADDAWATGIDLLSDWLQRLVRIGAGAAHQPELVNGEAAAMSRLARSADLDRWVEVWEKITQSVARAEALNTDRKLVILNIFAMLESVAGERTHA